MTAPLKPDTTGVNVEVFLRAWLLPIVETTPQAAGIGSKMWAAGSPKPYRAIRRITGAQDDYTDTPVVHIHTFGSDYTSASTAATATDDRLRVLMQSPSWNTTLPNGRIAHCDWLEIIAGAHEESYGAESVVTRFVTEVRLGMSFT